jgi:hypothetical protein
MNQFAIKHCMFISWDQEKGQNSEKKMSWVWLSVKAFLNRKINTMEERYKKQICLFPAGRLYKYHNHEKSVLGSNPDEDWFSSQEIKHDRITVQKPNLFSCGIKIGN